MSDRRRLDTGNIKNGVVEMAASIIYYKMESNIMIAEMRQERYGVDDLTALKLLKEAKRMEAAVKLIDELEGCWS